MSALALWALLACAGEVEKPVDPRDPDGDGWLDVDDCDDEDATVYPGAEERCDYIDNDCDQQVDEEDAVDGVAFYPDLDGDGYGNGTYPTEGCAPPEQYVANGLDCDDQDDSVHPEVEDGCDELDNDCDGALDEDAERTWYEDRDGDGQGRSDSVTQACDQPAGYASDWGDCDDLDADAYAGAPELCDGVDNDCGGTVDEHPVDGEPIYQDADGDGYGDPDASDTACGPSPEGWVATGGDCDDDDPMVNPGASERCNVIDDDCDGEVDEWAGDAIPWYADDDGDGHGDPARGRAECFAPVGFVLSGDDCDDTDAAISPDAEEVCDNAVDEDCDGTAASCAM